MNEPICITAFTDCTAQCTTCHQVKTFGDGYHLNGDKNVPDHVLSCSCGVEKVHEAKPRRATAMAWNIPPTAINVKVLRHKSVHSLWDGALLIPESCRQEHQECEYDHYWHGKKSAIAIPQVLSYAYTFDVPVTVTVDDKKYADINSLYGTNWDDSGFLLDENWYKVKRNSEVIAGLMRLNRDKKALHDTDKDNLQNALEGMVGNASTLTMKNAYALFHNL